MSKIFLFLYNYFKAHKLVFAMVLIASFAFSGYYASKIKLEEDLSRFIPKSNDTENYNLILQNFQFKDKLIVNISLSDSTAEANPDKLIEYAEVLVDSINNQLAPKYIKEITSKVSDDLMMNVYNTFYENIPIYLDDKAYLKIDSLIDPSALDSTLKENYSTLLSPTSMIMKKFIIRDPLGFTGFAFAHLKNLKIDDSYKVYNDYIFTADNKNLVLFVTSANTSSETAKNTELIDGLDKIISQFYSQNSNKANVDYFGAIAVGVGNAKQLKKDSMLTLMLAFSIIILVIFLFFRKKTIPFLVFLPVIFGTLFSLAIIYLTQGTVSAIALGAGSAILGIAINYSLHVFSHFMHTRSIKAVIEDLSVPLTLGSFTTIGAFLSLLFVKSEALQDFGLFSGLCLVGASLFSLAILPQFMNEKDAAKNHSEPFLFKMIDKLSGFQFKKTSIIFILCLILTVVFIFSSQKVEFESDMSSVNYISESLKKSEQRLDKTNNVKQKSVYVVSIGKDMNSAIREAEQVSRRLSKLKTNGTIGNFSDPVSIIISDSLQKSRIDKWNKYWTPEKKELLKKQLIETGAKYKFKESAFNEFYTLLNKKIEVQPIESFNEIRNLFLSEWIAESKDRSMIASMVKVDLNEKEKIYKAFEGNKNVVVFDRQKMTSKFVEVISSDFNLILLITSLLVFVTLLLSYGRIEMALITFAPMFLSWLWILGLMGLVGLKFNIINIIISTFIFGLGDDFSIFMMDGMIEGYKSGKKTLASFKTAIFLSAFTTIVGLGVLIFAKHPALKSIAVLTVVGMLSVLLITFIIQPVLFKWLVQNRVDKKRVPFTLWNLLSTLMAYIYFLTGCTLLPLWGIILLILPANKKTKKFIFHYSMMLYSRSLIYFFRNVKKTIVNEQGETFKEPAVIIGNHQSFVDILTFLMLQPKMILLTNDWVWNSPFFGRIVKIADFYRVSKGFEAIPENIKQKVKEGYSIVVFPEGTRSKDGNIGRFHKGAFYLAEQLNIDILPIITHGMGDLITKGELYMKSGTITMKILPRIKPTDKSFGETYSERTKLIGKYFKQQHQIILNQYATPYYYRNKFLLNYIYKGPIVEGYLRVKVRMENYYEYFNNLIPRQGKIVDIGCGYGPLIYMLSFLSKERSFLGIDYDAEKIEIANNCLYKNDNMEFVSSDALKYNLPKADVFVISDMLHYIPVEKQQQLITNCILNLNEGGMLLIRDANADFEKKKNHKVTKFTEFLSTNIGFNKTGWGQLYFSSEKDIRDVASIYGFNVEVVNNDKYTSNVFYILKK